MSIFKKEAETKRVIFNIELDLAQRLESAKQLSRDFGKKLDCDAAVNKAIEKFLKKAEKKLEEMNEKKNQRQKKTGTITPDAEGFEADNVDSDFDEENENDV